MSQMICTAYVTITITYNFTIFVHDNVRTIDISYTLDSASVYQKGSQKSQPYPIITIDGGHIGRSHSSMRQKTLYFLHLYIKYF